MCYPRPKMQPCWTRSLAAQHGLKCFFWLGCCFTFFVFLLVSVLKRRLETQVSRFHLWTGEGFPCPPRWCNLNWDVFPLNCCGLVVTYLASPPPMKRHCVEPQLGGAGKRVRGSRTVSCRCVSRIPSCLQRLCRTRWREVKSTGSRSREAVSTLPLTYLKDLGTYTSWNQTCFIMKYVVRTQVITDGSHWTQFPTW